MNIKKNIALLCIVILVVYSMSNKVYAISSLYFDSSKKIYKSSKCGQYSQESYKIFVKNKENWINTIEAEYKKFRKKGVTPAGACAYLGNLTALEIYVHGDIKYKYSNAFPVIKNKKLWNDMTTAKGKDLIRITKSIKDTGRIKGVKLESCIEYATDWYNYFNYKGNYTTVNDDLYTVLKIRRSKNKR